MKKSYKKRKRKNGLKKIFKGFTLVELLAVIVILAIIMLIAIPAVLNTLESARKKTFVEFATKSYDAAIKEYLNEQMSTGNIESCVVYNIKTDLGMNNTGDYNGYVLVVNEGTDQKYYLILYDDEFMIGSALYNDENINVDKILRFNNAKDEDLKAALALEGGCVNYTNKNDGSSESSISETGISRKLKVEDYVHYYPTETSFTPDSNLTGCAETDECDSFTLNPSTSTMWRVLKINDDGTVVIGGKSTEKYYLWGLTGYKNSVYLIREAASHYSDNKFMKSIRALGDEGEPDFLDDSLIDEIRSRISSYDYLSSIKPNYNATDINTFSGISYLSNSYLASRDTYPGGRMSVYEKGVCARNYWSNSGNPVISCSLNYGVNPLYGNLRSCNTGSYACKFMNGNVEGRTSNYIAIIVTLKANVKVSSGKGTYSDPYEFTF